MWSFEGDYRIKPKQSLSGKSRSVDKTTLLERLRTERENRENLKKQENASVLIQAWFRGCLSRRKVNEIRRQNFDIDLKTVIANHNGETLEKCILTLVKIFSIHKDYSRLLKVSQFLVQNKNSLEVWISARPSKWKLLLTRLLSFCLKILNEPVQNSSPIYPVLLRLLEIITSPSFLPQDHRNKFLLDMFEYLLKNNYYGHLTRFLISKMPPLYVTNLKPPSPFATFIMELLLFPLNIINQVGSDNIVFVDCWLEQFWKEILAKSSHSQIRFFVIPNFAESSLFTSHLKGKLLLFGYLKCTDITHFNVDMFTLISVLTLITPNYEFPSSDRFFQYLCIINAHLETCMDLTYNDLQSSDEDDEMSMDCNTDADSDLPAPNDICMEILDSQSHVPWVIKFLTKYSTETPILVAFSKLFRSVIVYYKYQLHQCRLLYAFVLNKSSLLRPTWSLLSSIGSGGQLENLKGRTLVQALSNGCYFDHNEIEVLQPVLILFCASLSAVLSTLHDSEFSVAGESSERKEMKFPFSHQEVKDMSTILRDVCVGMTELIYPNSRITTYSTSEKELLWRNCFKMCAGVLRHLHLRDTRLNLYGEEHWIAKKVVVNQKALEGLMRSEDVELHELLHSENIQNQGSKSYSISVPERRFFTLMQEVPFVFPFEIRMGIFRRAIHSEREKFQDSFMTRSAINLRVRRNYIYEDSIAQLDEKIQSNLKKRFRVRLINKAGASEAGIDGGGLFREFSSELLKAAFDPNRGFFMLTNDNMLYPNPGAPLLHENFEKHYYFIGRMVGKIIFEHHLVEIPLARFFLTKLISENSSVEFHYLDSLDPDLCRNLLSLKNYNEDNVQDLGLDFTVTTSELGTTKVIDLVPNGSNIPVTKDNCIEYIYRMADYKLNKQIAKQCQAFREGLNEMIDGRLLRMFSWKEFQMLISGAFGTIDVDDLRNNTVYAGTYTITHPNIVCFWNVVEIFDETQRRQLIKFVTSCSRPPLSGFKELSPPFTISPSGDEDRLPSASTCMNLLKLPCYNDQDLLKEKLLYAINSGTGFELS